MKLLIEAQNLELFTPDGRLLNRPLSFKLETGELLLIEGPNGAGKSTLLRTILGLHKKFRGKLNNNLAEHDFSYLPQLGNVQFFLPLNLHDVISLQAKNASTEKEIENLGLIREKTLESPWNSASGGERQKALLTRCLLSDARVLILDEPLNHLDQNGTERVRETIASLLVRGKSIIMVSHNTDWTEIPKIKKVLLKRPNQ